MIRRLTTSLTSALCLTMAAPLVVTATTHAADPVPTAPHPESMMSKPTITIPEKTAPPTTLQSEERQVGTGAEAVAGKTVVVQYVGVSWSTGKEFDSSWDRRQPFSFKLGGGQVIKGWDQGVAGMKVGGRRQLVIPPDLAYGNRAVGGVIKANETLVFVVDLLEVK